MIFRRTSLLLLALLISAGCDPYSQDDFEEFVVVESYLTANRPLPEIRVSRTLPVDQSYSFGDAALDNAFVTVLRLDEDGDVAEELPYQLTSSGVYNPQFPHVVRPLTRYRLNVTFSGRPEQITAETIIPDQISILNDVPSELVYQGEEQLEILLSTVQNTDGQNVYIFNTISKEPAIDRLTPFYQSAMDDDNFQEFINNSSGLVNEGNFTLNEDGTTTLFFPWIGVAFYGENEVVTSSVDRNVSDLLRSQSVQLGGSTLPPGEIPNVIYNVDGGIGVFGSFSADTVRTRFLRPE